MVLWRKTLNFKTKLKEVANNRTIRKKQTDYDGDGEICFTPYLETYLGVQMFQIASLIAIHDKNKSLKIVESVPKKLRNGMRFVDWNNVFKKNIVDHYADRARSEYDVVLIEDIQVAKGRIYKELPVFPRKRVLYYVIGYSYKYFEDIDIHKYFTFKDEITNHVQEKYENLLKYKTVSLHVRRTDKISKREGPKFWHCDNEYYETALSMLKDIEKVVVFSDDIEWCKKNFKGNKFVFIEGESRNADMYLMSLMHNNITATSHYGWWGAYLNQNKDKRVICPAYFYKYYPDKEEAYYNKKYYYPASWTLIDNRR
jgi:hypothetical protein